MVLRSVTYCSPKPQNPVESSKQLFFVRGLQALAAAQFPGHLGSSEGSRSSQNSDEEIEESWLSGGLTRNVAELGVVGGTEAEKCKESLLEDLWCGNTRSKADT